MVHDGLVGVLKWRMDMAEDDAKAREPIIAGAGLHLQYNIANSWEAIYMLNFMIHSISDDMY